MRSTRSQPLAKKPWFSISVVMPYWAAWSAISPAESTISGIRRSKYSRPFSPCGRRKADTSWRIMGTPSSAATSTWRFTRATSSRSASGSSLHRSASTE